MHDTRANAADGLSGILIVDKPVGWTSHDAVARVRRLLRMKRVGHTGTLDPFATGVLVILLGRATRLAQFLSGAEKEYDATIRFGYRTDTGDATGARVAEVQETNELAAIARDTIAPCRFDESELETAMANLRGRQEQIPPMYSAKKIAGRKLYELARCGREVARQPASIFVREYVALFYEDGTWLKRNTDGTCDVRARVVCSAGTYVRVLAEDLGARLGTPAHLAALRRTRAGAFALQDAVTLDELQSLAETNDARAMRCKIVSPTAALPEMLSVHLNDEQVARVRHGVGINAALAETVSDRVHVKMLASDGALVAVGTFERETCRVRPRVLLVVSGNESGNEDETKR